MFSRDNVHDERQLIISGQGVDGAVVAFSKCFKSANTTIRVSYCCVVYPNELKEEIADRGTHFKGHTSKPGRPKQRMHRGRPTRLRPRLAHAAGCLEDVPQPKPWH